MVYDARRMRRLFRRHVCCQCMFLVLEGRETDVTTRAVKNFQKPPDSDIPQAY